MVEPGPNGGNSPRGIGKRPWVPSADVQERSTQFWGSCGLVHGGTSPQAVRRWPRRCRAAHSFVEAEHGRLAGVPAESAALPQ
jgi:hypothetical protein